MKLKEARSSAIKYCEENKCNYTYISYSDLEEFYPTAKENQHTVFFINRNGSLKPCRSTQYAADFHKELKKRKRHRRSNNKKFIAEAINRDLTSEHED